MNEPNVVEHYGLSLDISQLKCFRLNIVDNTNIVEIEYKSSYGYIYNPLTEEYEKHKYSDNTLIEFSDKMDAEGFVEEWSRIWQDYLDGNL